MVGGGTAKSKTRVSVSNARYEASVFMSRKFLNVIREVLRYFSNNTNSPSINLKNVFTTDENIKQCYTGYIQLI